MADKLGYEVDYLSRWLPKKMDEDQTRQLIDAVIADLGVTGDGSAAGRVIGTVMKQHGADLDGGMVNRLVREALSGD